MALSFTNKTHHSCLEIAFELIACVRGKKDIILGGNTAAVSQGVDKNSGWDPITKIKPNEVVTLRLAQHSFDGVSQDICWCHLQGATAS